MSQLSKMTCLFFKVLKPLEIIIHPESGMINIFKDFRFDFVKFLENFESKPGYYILNLRNLIGTYLGDAMAVTLAEIDKGAKTYEWVELSPLFDRIPSHLDLGLATLADDVEVFQYCLDNSIKLWSKPFSQELGRQDNFDHLLFISKYKSQRGFYSVNHGHKIGRFLGSTEQDATKELLFENSRLKSDWKPALDCYKTQEIKTQDLKFLEFYPQYKNIAERN